MWAIAGWSRVGGQFQVGLSFWFALALAAELVAFSAYVLAYRSVAAIEGGPRLSLTETTELVAAGFSAVHPDRENSTICPDCAEKMHALQRDIN